MSLTGMMPMGIVKISYVEIPSIESTKAETKEQYPNLEFRGKHTALKSDTSTSGGVHVRYEDTWTQKTKTENVEHEHERRLKRNILGPRTLTLPPVSY